MSLALFSTLLLPPLLALWIPNRGQAQDTPGEGVTITVLFDNLWTDDRMQVGWGFAALVETPGHTVLFDTGADGEILLGNLRLAGKDPRAIEAVVISHAHGDHTGGLEALLSLGIHPRLFLLASFPAALREAVASHARVLEAVPGQEIVPGIRTTGPVGEAIPEQALILETAEGTVVLTGCAHPGVVTMTRRAQELREGPVHAVLGGFHLMDQTGAEVQAVLGAFRAMGVERAGPTHCSGLRAMTAFQEAYGERFVRMGVGRVLRFQAPGGA